MAWKSFVPPARAVQQQQQLVVVSNQYCASIGRPFRTQPTGRWTARLTIGAQRGADNHPETGILPTSAFKRKNLKQGFPKELYKELYSFAHHRELMGMPATINRELTVRVFYQPKADWKSAFCGTDQGVAENTGRSCAAAWRVVAEGGRKALDYILFL